MTYTMKTKTRVTDFIKSKKSVTITEVYFLGDKKQQISKTQLDEVLEDLVEEKLVKVTETDIGKRTFKTIWWLKVKL